jgi:hypothetical protein
MLQVTTHKSTELLLLLLCFTVLSIIIFYLFSIRDLFNDAVSSPDYILSHGTMASGGCVRK